MLRNYLKIAFRNVWKNKVFSIINILGLSIGLSAAFVIGAMVFYDLTFDNFHSESYLLVMIYPNFLKIRINHHFKTKSVCRLKD